MKYCIQITGSKKSGYYAAASRWTPVLKEQADKVARKDVDRICSALRKLGYQVAREECK
jgi:hypothetical protein